MRTADVLAPAAQASVGPGADEREQRRRKAAALYVEHGLSLAEAGRVLGVDATTVRNDLDAQGIPRRHSERPEPRECALEGCHVVFTPTSTQLASGYGRYCSRAHGHAGRRKHPEPAPRECALEGCDIVFTPPAFNVARGWGDYCSPAHARRGSKRRRGKGRMVTCAYCGADIWRYDSELRELNFCSRGVRGRRYPGYCWGRYRLEHGLAGAQAFLSPSAGGAARRLWKLRWAPKPGRPRQYSELRAKAVLELRKSEPTLGVRQLAARAGLTVKQVRGILARDHT